MTTSTAPVWRIEGCDPAKLPREMVSGVERFRENADPQFDVVLTNCHKTGVQVAFRCARCCEWSFASRGFTEIELREPYGSMFGKDPNAPPDPDRFCYRGCEPTYKESKP